VFKPVQRPGFSDGERVRMTVESVRRSTPKEILDLVTHVYDGLSEQDGGNLRRCGNRVTAV